MKREIHVWHLELLVDDAPPQPLERPFELVNAAGISPDYARFLYVTVGAPWCWYLRLNWTWAQWESRLNDESVQLWIAHDNGIPVGYFELERTDSHRVQICYFGLTPEHIGQGFGRTLLEHAIVKARAWGGKRICLHTCTLDHENALANYLARGFQVVREEDIAERLPDRIEPWPGARAPRADSRQKKGRRSAP